MPESVDKDPQAREDAINEKYAAGEELEDEFYSEIEMVKTILSKFIFRTTSQRENQIDLNLILKALPVRVDAHNCGRVDLFNFGCVQDAQVAFANKATDMLFKYYDNRNKSRLRKLREKAKTTSKLTNDLKQLAITVSTILNKIDDNGQKGGLRAAQKKEFDNLVLSEDDLKKHIASGIKGLMSKMK